MAAPIGPGDFVECIDCRGRPDLVRVGAVYLVEDADEYRGIPCLTLKGVVHPGGFRRVRADCFRPIYRPRADFIRSLKAPPINAPARVREEA